MHCHSAYSLTTGMIVVLIDLNIQKSDIFADSIVSEELMSKIIK